MIYIKFANQTYAEMARKALYAEGIRSNIRRNPNPNHREGCNFALFVSGNIDRAYQIISKRRIDNLGIESFGGGR